MIFFSSGGCDNKIGSTGLAEYFSGGSS